MSATNSGARRPRRKRSRWRSPISLDTLSTLLVVVLLLMMPLAAMDIAGWAVEMDIVLLITLLSVPFSLVLARSRFGEFSALIVSFLYGLLVALLVTAANQQLPFREALAAVVTRCYEWAVDLFSGGINTDELVLTMLVAVLFWFLAYNANWHIFRLDRVWRAVLPPGLILLVNMVFFSGDEALDRFLFGYLLLALVLIVRSHLDARQWEWAIRGVSVPTLVRRQFATIGLLLSVIALTFAWGLPSSQLDERLQHFQRFLASDPIQQIAEVWNQIVRAD